jgi:hypothetical protein
MNKLGMIFIINSSHSKFVMLWSNDEGSTPTKGVGLGFKKRKATRKSCCHGHTL